MPKISTDIRKIKKTYDVLHDLPGEMHHDYILLPSGYMLNRSFEGAQRGDTLSFFTGEEREILSARKIPMDALCNSLCYMRYGVVLKKILEEWQTNAVLLGNSKNSVSTEECWIVFFKEYDFKH